MSDEKEMSKADKMIEQLRTQERKRAFNYLNERVKILDTGCHVWTGKGDKDGYGKAKLNQTSMRANRLMFYLCNLEQPIERGILVCHTCDVPGCINPDHLFSGTPSDNTVDMFSKGRVGTGYDLIQRTGQIKLTPEQVRDIYVRACAGEFYRDIATEHNICSTLVCNIRNRSSWGYITQELFESGIVWKKPTCSEWLKASYERKRQRNKTTTAI